MNSNHSQNTFAYVAAFLTGYIGAILPILADGSFPTTKAMIAAIAPALIATGLFHTPSPNQDKGAQ